ncbi:L-tyrosine:2-oxoglutarate aminotransferase [Trametes coccinea BRFM310]|uniref:L-tyrosine:2-oxoglutarate aminotransferase n=1 Tax=Trametes coccinea (strain BRFM310) TaxID=1353009 RepID=A0A1Y2IHJ8_TRAC3|nr:L-tyrosine:2-oxoglutarate aminotransferase [Trametes coccinea BRFM310]
MSTSNFVDVSHHLSPETRARGVNPMKDIIRIALENPNLIALANGDPDSALNPISRIDYSVASVTSGEDPVLEWIALGANAPTQVLSTSQDEESKLRLRTALRYGHGAGHPDALQTVSRLTNAYHHAPHHVPTMTLGNADAITKVFRLLGGPGDYFLADEFTFIPMPLAAEAHGVKWVPVTIDAGGIVPEELERILASWDPERGRRPHVLYTVPSGQNPTGSTLTVERRKRIYEIAQRYDLIIVEDDPYYFLQYDLDKADGTAPKKFPPSFLSMDVDGRVIRIDSFSKIMAPGMRLGWITSHPTFHNHLVKLIDLSTQHPHGFGQVLITQLLGPSGWQLTGFDRWVRGLCAEYQRRRDLLLALFARDVASTGLASTYVPQAGMFLWARVHFERHPRFKGALPLEGRAGDGEGARVPRTNTRQLMKELFDACVAGGLLICPAYVFTIGTDPKYDDVPSHVDDRSHFIRLTFAGSEETMTAGIPILGRVLKEFFAGAPEA